MQNEWTNWTLIKKYPPSSTPLAIKVLKLIYLHVMLKEKTLEETCCMWLWRWNDQRSFIDPFSLYSQCNSLNIFIKFNNLKQFIQIESIFYSSTIFLAVEEKQISANVSSEQISFLYVPNVIRNVGSVFIIFYSYFNYMYFI